MKKFQRSILKQKICSLLNNWEALGREEKESAQKELKILKIGPLKKELFI